MSFFETLKGTLQEIPLSDIMRARLELALDQSASFEREIADLQAQKAKLQAELQIIALDRDKCRQEYQRLKDEHAEEIRIHSAIEFRRGKRTAGKWDAFCPKCKMPAIEDKDEFDPLHLKKVVRCSASCSWSIPLPKGITLQSITF